MDQEQVINTGDPSMDREIADQIRQGFESGGMTVELSAAPGGGVHIRAKMPASFATPNGQVMEMPKAGSFELGGTDGADMKTAAQRGDLGPTLHRLSSAKAAGDWDDYFFIAQLVAPECPVPTLDRVCVEAPVDGRVLRVASLLKRGWDARGGGTADTITEDGAQTMAKVLESARMDALDAARLDPKNPTPHAQLIEVATLHDGMGRGDAEAAFRQALERHTANLGAFRNMLRLCGQKWGGTHAAQLQVARAAASRATHNPDLLGYLFYAHIEIWFFQQHFEGNPAAAQGYLVNGLVQSELNQAFDGWITPAYRQRPVSPLQLHLPAAWYFMISDLGRLKRVVSVINMVQVTHPWQLLGEPTMMWTQAIQRAV